MAQELTTRFEVRELPSPNEEVAILELSGELDAHTAPQFERFLERIVREEAKRKLVLDFHHLEYISSAGLGVLMGLIEEARQSGGDIKLAALPDKIFHVLDLLGFPVVFQIVPTIADAVAAYK